MNQDPDDDPLRSSQWKCASGWTAARKMASQPDAQIVHRL